MSSEMIEIRDTRGDTAKIYTFPYIGRIDIGFVESNEMSYTPIQARKLADSLYAKASAIDNQPSRAQQCEELLRELLSAEPLVYDEDNDPHCLYCNGEEKSVNQFQHAEICPWHRAKQLLEVE